MSLAEHPATPEEVISAINNYHWQQLHGSELREGRGEAAPIINPSTKDVLTTIAWATRDDVTAVVNEASDAAAAWAARGPYARAAIVRELADALEKRAEDFAWLDTIDAGLPLWMMRIDIVTGIARMRMFADMAHALTGQSLPGSPQGLHVTTPEPFGVVARIIPFNHPFMFAASKIAAPLVAGNTVVLKPSELTPLSALLLGEVAAEVLPSGVLSVVHGGPDVGDQLVRDKRVHRIAFTGSHGVGRSIQQAGAEVGVKSVSLELGGKNALIAYDDADIDGLIASAVKGMNFAFAGQSCGSTSRLLVQRSIFTEVRDRVAEAVARVRQGLPWEEGVQIGPMISQRQQERALGFIERAREAGAELLVGGSHPTELSSGWYVEPTVLTGMTPDAEIAQEEVFGPVLSIMPFDSEEEAITIANSVDYGLTGSVWTQDIDRAFRTARALEAGYVWINDTSTHFPGVPFGGVKLSGIGREESLEELLSYTQTRAINVVLR
ncbi:aldehyde dehydrogenase family protein [Microbacterium sp. YY-01]|uniref:aldehyde dehydrogenase family protein n=1 Tax=Microbacterium sp. YY-01 TaxID=3421634 RepID=UPI003D17E0E6